MGHSCKYLPLFELNLFTKDQKKRQHDTILKGLVQELDSFETQMKETMQTLESKLKVINDEVIFYNRLYLVLILVTFVIVFLFSQAARIRTT